MLIILGIVVLAVSFVIALISLVVEERKREKLTAEHEDVESKELPDEVAPGDVLPEEPQPWYQELTSTQAKDARLPPSLGPQSSLSGEIKIGDISKKQQ